MEPERTEPDPSRPDDRLGTLLDDLWRWLLDATPELAAYVGEPLTRAWTDYSPDACADRRATRRRFLDTVTALPTEALAEEDAVSHRVAEAHLAAEAAVDRFPHEAALVDQMNGVHLGICQSLDYMGLATEADCETYVGRLRAIPTLLDQVTALLREPAARAARPPRVVLADVPRQIRTMAPVDGPLLDRLRRAGDLVPELLMDAAADAVRDEVGPALGRFERFVVDELVPQAREEPGISAVVDGEEWYVAAIAQQTSLRLSPREIHDIGLDEVSRIWQAMESLATEAGAGSVAGLRQRLHDDPASYFATPEEQLAAYRALCKEIDATLWRVVTRLPRMPYGVDPMPAYMAESAPTAYYIPGAGQARRPGSFIVNGHDLPSRPSWRTVPLAMHEAVPGHHLQHAIADELTELPPLRRHLHWNAYVEGWGLYAEHLGEELGFYRTPADRYGRLSFDMWRAARLVVDTGIHAFGWSRDTAIAYLLEKTGLGHHDVVAEVDRYIAWPAQALGYKLGERVILDLRREAATLRGAAFRAEEFHDVVLQRGPLPLPVLQDEVRRWAAADR